MPSVRDIAIRKPTKQEIEDCRKWPIWTCEASCFDWDYTQKEICLILEGQVIITDGKNSVSFGAGDLVIFPVDLKCTWKIEKAVRKHYNFE